MRFGNCPELLDGMLPRRHAPFLLPATETNSRVFSPSIPLQIQGSSLQAYHCSGHRFLWDVVNLKVGLCSGYPLMGIFSSIIRDLQPSQSSLLPQLHWALNYCFHSCLCCNKFWFIRAALICLVTLFIICSNFLLMNSCNYWRGSSIWHSMPSSLLSILIDTSSKLFRIGSSGTILIETDFKTEIGWINQRAQPLFTFVNTGNKITKKL